MDDAGHEPEDDGDAVRAFEALREEVAALRRGVELVYRQGQQTAPGAPDYSPTLGQMEQALQAIAARLEAVERQPALTLTPARFRTEIDSVASGAVSTISRPFIEAVQEARAAARDLKALTGRVHERQEQRTWLLIVGAFGLIVGVGLWYVAAGLLPRSVGDGIAASLIGGTRWQAGETLMDEASPASFDKMVRLYQACGEQTTALCEAAVAVRSIQPGQEGGRSASAPVPSHPLPRGGRGERQGQ
jgi:Family of unknown function (DUF6118)